MRNLVLVLAIGLAPALGAQSSTAEVKAQLKRMYAANAAAFERWDVAAIMALRHPEFHTITPDGRRSDRAAMESYITGILNGIKKWNEAKFTIDSLSLSGDTATAIVRQYIDRMALRPDNEVHHVQTWVTQRETWLRVGGRWLMWRVDQLRDQRRVVDGKPG